MPIKLAEPNSNTMEKHIKKKWLKALRGESPLGVYTQGRKKLCSYDDKFCCLGVLVNETCGFNEDTTVFWGLYPRNLNHGESSFPNQDTARSWGLSTQTQRRLADMNDEGYSFEEIADYIEENC